MKKKGVNDVTMDGNEAAAYISYAFTEIAGIFPITPSSPMAEHVDAWSAMGKQNVFGQRVDVVEMQSEGGAAGAVHGSLEAGALTTTYTASQGLLLMIPNMYKIAGEMLPGVFHVSARTLSSHALSIFGDHSDVMACRQTGFAMLASTNPQEAMDLGAVAHLSAIKCRMPFLHFFDGFRTSHEIQKIEALGYAELKPLIDMDSLNAFRRNALNPDHPCTRGLTVNPDIFFQAREACNKHYDIIPEVCEQYMSEINKIAGRDYHLFNYYGAEDATDIIIAMGSVVDTIQETVDYLNASGKKVGVVNVHLYRPFSLKYFSMALPSTVERIAVLDRTKEPGGLGEPLYLDVMRALQELKREGIKLIGGRFGLSSKDTTPAQIISVYENLAAKESRSPFTVGIEDDITFLSLPVNDNMEISSEGLVSCKIWGLGSDGTVGANKNSIKIIGDNTDMYTQAYFVYDSKKSGGLTQSHLRFGSKPIRSTYLVSKADFVACHNPSYVDRYNLVRDLKKGATFLLNCSWNTDEIEQHLPGDMKRTLAEKKINFYTIDAIGIAKGLGLGNRTNTVLQAAFFKLVDILPIEEAVGYMKEAIEKTYANKGQKIVDINCAAVDAGIINLHKMDIPVSWLTAVNESKDNHDLPEFVREIVVPMNRQEGDALPVSKFEKIADGTWPNGMTAFEKRGAAVDVPQWDPDKCIQCNQCALVCPHAAIRPILLDEKESMAAPQGFVQVQAKGSELSKYKYRMQVSPYDCTGCSSCAVCCPAKEKALMMKPLESQLSEAENWKYAIDEVSVKKNAINDRSIKNSQFAQPLFEFPGACAGCGETPYIKLATQLFGDRMYIANASGCSTAYGGGIPGTPYTKNKQGQGPAWAMSLFEDCAEYGFGMLLGAEKVRERLAAYAEVLLGTSIGAAAKDYLEFRNDTAKSPEVSQSFLKALGRFSPSGSEEKEMVEFIAENSDFLRKRSYWAFGGDGWAYDIGYGGLDHVLASGRNINLLVLDTEVYSNTGGQSSKSTGVAAIAKFASSGKKTKKKDLGLMAMSYGYVYVAQVAMGYDQNQVLKAMREAEAYDGPSLIIAYCPCIEHGLKSGMSKSQLEMKNAVKAGYWHLYRFNPELKKEGKNPFILDSKEPTESLRDFLRGEVRYSSLELMFPETADALFQKAEQAAKERLDSYRDLSES